VETTPPCLRTCEHETRSNFSLSGLDAPSEPRKTHFTPIRKKPVTGGPPLLVPERQRLRRRSSFEIHVLIEKKSRTPTALSSLFHLKSLAFFLKTLYPTADVANAPNTGRSPPDTDGFPGYKPKKDLPHAPLPSSKAKSKTTLPHPKRQGIRPWSSQ